MGKVFRLHTKGRISIEGWMESSHYTTQEIESIKDPAGASSLYKITSIPTPFANMDLVRNALMQLKDKKMPLDGKTIYHKTISDMLDVAQTFFFKHALRNKHKVEIITWKAKNELEILAKSSNSAHKTLGDTLRIYLQQDQETYNFDLLENIYIIEIDSFVVGGTSPATLFFPSPNNLYEKGLRIKFENDTLFDQEYYPLYKRSPDFIRILFAIFKKNDILLERDSTRLLWEYMQRCLEEEIRKNNSSLYTEIQSYTKETFDKNFDRLEANTEGDYIQPLRGVYLGRVKQQNIEQSASKSDFVIKPSLFPADDNKKLPLVLPTEQFNLPLTYINSFWNPETRVPYKDPQQDLNQRVLPGVAFKYPYLTVDDFLEPYLITLPYSFNTEHYFYENISQKTTEERKSYLLPLKPLFFEYFTLEDLDRNVQGDKKMFEIKEGVRNSVIVTLRIPIQKNEIITYERTYYELSNNQPDISETQNKGAILKTVFNLVLYPIFKLNTGEYRIQLIDNNKKTKDIELFLFKGTEKIKEDLFIKTQRMNKDDINPSIYYYIVPAEQSFDYLQVFLPSHNARGIIIPKFKSASALANRIHFAVDFGTTNTHIQYKFNDDPDKPLTYQDLVQNAAPLVAKNLTYKLELTEMDLIRSMHLFICNQDKETKQYTLPMRTAILQSDLVKESRINYALSDFNIAWTYHTKQHQYARTELYKTNLKWLSNEDPLNIQAKERFLEEIAIHLYVISAANRCGTHNVTLSWFYPSSMTSGQIRKLEEIWDEVAKKHLPNATIKSYPESYPPFYYYKSMNRIKGGSSNYVVSIDIGGGTTDVAIIQDVPKLLSSFNFAGGVIFGSGFHEQSSNRLTEYYHRRYTEIIKGEEYQQIRQILDDCKHKPAEFNSFLFKMGSLDKDFADNPALNYAKLLSNDSEFKIALLYFYTAIVYHIADLMKFKQLTRPTEIFFSGTASKSLNILSSERFLGEYTTELFKFFFPDTPSIKIVLEKDVPKELTCKGGLYIRDEMPDLREIKTQYSGIHENEQIKWEDIKNDGPIVEKYLSVIQKFHEVFKKLDEVLNFKDFFGIEYKTKNRFFKAMDEVTQQHYKDFIADGYKFRDKVDALETTRIMDEPAFFYPLVGVIQNWLNHEYREGE
ncbi:MAG: hypothetical protein NZ519_01540 [Bacteroidia bacterium]|nr:hypothetical protein [Bacteroidia bacterium]